ncbi:MAG: thioredoxin family protein [Bacteroidales bacterium]|nr:thioredoxin family protein [Bacteroidales bacterium]
MKNLVSLIVILTIGISAFAQGIQFEHISFDEALAKAGKEGKMVFMDCYTEWCGPCKALAKNVFPQKEVGDYFNANFINLKMDMEKGEGPALLKRYEVKGFPTLLFLDAEGNVLYKRVGGSDAAGLIADARSATDPMQRMDYVKKKYDEGDRSKEIVTTYIGLLNKAYMKEEVQKVGAEYVKALSNKDLLDAANFEAYRAVGDAVDGEKFKYVKANKYQFIALTNQQTIDGFIMMTYYENMQKAAAGSDIKKLDEAIELYKTEFSEPMYHQGLEQLYDKFYLSNHQFDKWFEAKETAIANYQPDDKQYENTLIRAAYRIAADPLFANVEGAYNRAIAWFELAIKANNESMSAYSGLALVYQKMNNKEQASKNIALSIEKCKEQGLDIDQRLLDLQKTIEKM